MSTSPAQVSANRSNSLFSTGPTTDAGKAKVSMNAVKTGLTGRTVVLPFDDAAAYQKLILDYQNEFQPVGPLEAGLVQSITDVIWRLDRIPALIMALVNMGRADLTPNSPHATPAADAPALELQIGINYEKHFHNLQLQENRLVRRRDKEIKDLLVLQKTRKQAEAQAKEEAAQAAKPTAVAETALQPAQTEPTPAAPEGQTAEIGFEFSTAPTALAPEPSTAPKPAGAAQNQAKSDAATA